MCNDDDGYVPVWGVVRKKSKEAPKNAELHPLTVQLLYGDINKAPLSALKGEIKTEEGLDDFQSCRVACAATVQAWIDRKSLT